MYSIPWPLTPIWLFAVALDRSANDFFEWNKSLENEAAVVAKEFMKTHKSSDDKSVIVVSLDSLALTSGAFHIVTTLVSHSANLDELPMVGRFRNHVPLNGFYVPTFHL